MPALAPVPNIGSQIERAIIAWLYACYGGARDIDSFYFSNDWKERIPPLIEVMAHKSTETVTHSRIESYAVKIDAKWQGPNQPGVTNLNANWKSINDFVGVVMAAMSQSDTGGQDYRATALQIAQHGRRLAVFGSALTTQITGDLIAANADMVDFYCDYIEFKGSQRAEVAGGELFIKEIRHFEVRAGNVVDASVFPALTFDEADTVNWTFTAGAFAEPDFWIVEKSVDGLVWTLHTNVATGERTADISGTGTQFWRVRRSEDGVIGLDPESNILRATAV